MGSIQNGKRIIVPQRSVNGGLAFKFDTDPYGIDLHGLLTPEQFTEAIENLNTKLRPSRPGAIDATLLATGPLLVPLAVWGVRHRLQTKKRKRLLKEGIHEFNTCRQYQDLGLCMRWNRRPAQSVLLIERRQHQGCVVVADGSIGGNFDGEMVVASEPPRGNDFHHIAQATLLPSSIDSGSRPPLPQQQQQVYPRPQQHQQQHQQHPNSRQVQQHQHQHQQDEQLLVL
ncbi:unnamed protein product [Pseudo-nitzschia multistriata]|uniref:Uncharacterized protein n=1 Tax=Pseudo-nitzschia multistriata TaxID=183589 RepID=A0A448ZPI7_9STRA|nr:unnamed protein product [Pseudo-nitzschia multistriata]